MNQTVDQIISDVDRVMIRKVIKDQSAPFISDHEIEKKVDYILSDAEKPLVFNNEDFLKVKGAFINRVRSNRRNTDLRNRIIELLQTAGRRTRRTRKSRRTRKYKK